MIHHFLVIIYYVVGILAFLWEGCCVTNSEKIFNFKQKFIKKVPGEKIENQATFTFLMSGYVSWCIIGLMSSFNWVLFLGVILSGFVPQRNATMIKIMGIIPLIFLFMIYINQFQFHTNVYQILKNLL